MSTPPNVGGRGLAPECPCFYTLRRSHPLGCITTSKGTELWWWLEGPVSRVCSGRVGAFCVGGRQLARSRGEASSKTSPSPATVRAAPPGLTPQLMSRNWLGSLRSKRWHGRSAVQVTESPVTEEAENQNHALLGGMLKTVANVGSPAPEPCPLTLPSGPRRVTPVRVTRRLTSDQEDKRAADELDRLDLLVGTSRAERRSALPHAGRAPDMSGFSTKYASEEEWYCGDHKTWG